jgi:hypothetical protein
MTSKDEEGSVDATAFTNEQPTSRVAIESNYLFHGRGARSNLTKIDENGYDLLESKSFLKLNFSD